MIDKLKIISNFDYLKTEKTSDDCDFYYFGWKDGLHFYLDEYYKCTELEGKFILNVWLNKQHIFEGGFYEIEPLINEINQIIKRHSYIYAF